MGATPEEWEAFRRQWSMFKTGTAIATPQVATALFYCCSEELRLDLMRDIRSDVATMPEASLLENIKRLAVREESVLVHRIRLSKMVQTPGKKLPRKSLQASLCKVTSRCTEQDCHHTFD